MRRPVLREVRWLARGHAALHAGHFWHVGSTVGMGPHVHGSPITQYAERGFDGLPSRARLLCPWDSSVKNTGVDCHVLLQGIFPTQEVKLGLLHCKQILYRLSYERYSWCIILYVKSVQWFTMFKACMKCSVMSDSCDPVDCSLPDSSLRGISQARIMEWVAVSSSRWSSQPKDRTRVSCISCTAGEFFTAEPLGKLV